MLTLEKQNFLRISFEPNRGLKLNWNFNNLSATEHYFRHIFVISSQKSKYVFSILDSLYKKMKHGDLFCCVYAHNSNIYKVNKWVEKSHLTSFKPQRYFKQRSNRALDKQLKVKLIEGAGKQAQEFDEPVVINFLGVQKSQLYFYKNEIMRHRFALISSYKYIVNFFGDFQQNVVSIHTGMNVFKTEVPNFLDHAEYYHKLINRAAVQSAHVDITALNGQLTLLNETLWKTTDFNRISASYYGPSSKFDSETIYFLNKEQNMDYEPEFQVSLSIQLLQNKVLQSSKRIKLNFFNEKEYSPTFHYNRFHFFFTDGKISLSDNPNKCELVVKYKSNKYQSHNFDDF